MYNALFSYILASVSLHKETQSIIIMMISWFVAGVIGIKFTGSLFYYIWYFLYFKPFKMNRVGSNKK